MAHIVRLLYAILLITLLSSCGGNKGADPSPIAPPSGVAPSSTTTGGGGGLQPGGTTGTGGTTPTGGGTITPTTGGGTAISPTPTGGTTTSTQFPQLQNPLSSQDEIRRSIYFTMADQNSPFITSGSPSYDGVNIYSLDTIPPVNLSTGTQSFQHTLHLEKAKLAAVSDMGYVFSYVLNPNVTGPNDQFLLIVSKLDDPNFQPFTITALGMDDHQARTSDNGQRLAVFAQDSLGRDEIRIFDIDYANKHVNSFWPIGVAQGQNVTEHFVLDPDSIYLYIAMREGLGYFLARYNVATQATSQVGEKFLDLNLAVSVNNTLSSCVDPNLQAIKISEIKKLYLWFDVQSAPQPMFILVWNSADHMFMLPIEVGGMTLIGTSPISPQNVIDNTGNVFIAGCFGTVGPYNIVNPLFSMKEDPRYTFILSSKSPTIADKFLGVFSPPMGQFHRQDISHDIEPQSGGIKYGSANPILQTSDYILNIMAP